MTGRPMSSKRDVGDRTCFAARGQTDHRGRWPRCSRDEREPRPASLPHRRCRRPRARVAGPDVAWTLGLRLLRGSALVLLCQGQVDDERAAVAGSAAFGANRSAVQRDEAPYDRQPRPRPPRSDRWSAAVERTRRTPCPACPARCRCLDPRPPTVPCPATRLARTAMRDSGSLYFAALVRRLAMTCASR